MIDMLEKYNENQSLFWEEYCNSMKKFKEKRDRQDLLDATKLLESMERLLNIRNAMIEEYGGGDEAEAYRSNAVSEKYRMANGMPAYMPPMYNRRVVYDTTRNGNPDMNWNENMRMYENNYPRSEAGGRGGASSSQGNTSGGSMSNRGGYRNTGRGGMRNDGWDVRIDRRDEAYSPNRRSQMYNRMYNAGDMMDDPGYKKWGESLMNADGSEGAHWEKQQTTSVAKNMGVQFDEITEDDFWITMNMMYSDYCETAKKYNVDKPEFYACLACDFLMDEDAKGTPSDKLKSYYNYIVE